MSKVGEIDYSLEMQERKLATFALSPKIIERVLRVFPTERLDDRIERDRFTAREVVAHLADYEQVVLDRINAAIENPGRTVPGYDPDAQCVAHHFSDKDIFHEAEVFESRRATTVERLHHCSDKDWNAVFVIESTGKGYTVREYVDMLILHDIEHLDQLSSYLATEVATMS